MTRDNSVEVSTLKHGMEVAVEAAATAADLIRARFSEIKSIANKPEGKGIVTDVDLAAEEAILRILRRDSPYPIQSEESGTRLGEGNLTWIVDPLDGTTNYSRGVPLVGVSIALMHGSKSLVGVIVNPFTGETFSALDGGGAYVNGSPIFVSQKRTGAAPVIALNAGYTEESKVRFGVLARAFSDNTTIRRLGSTAIEMSLVARGAFDAFICSGDELWDYAAGLVIVKEAGGVISDWKGNMEADASDFILVASPWVHRQIVDRIATSGAI